MKDKKGQVGLGSMYSAVLTIVLVVIALGVGLMVLDKLRTQIGTSSPAYNATNTSIAALGGFADWLPIIVVVIAAAIILGLIVHSFVGRKTA